MSIIISGIALPFETPQEEAIVGAVKLLKGAPITKATIVKRSIDARRKDQIKFVYSVAMQLDGGEEALVKKLANPQITSKVEKSLELTKGSFSLNTPPVIVGFGPAGMFAGLLLAREGYNPVIIERGQEIDQRVQDVESFWQTGKLDTESNVQFGEGGAGTFSDGKLTTRISDSRCQFILKELVRYGAPEEILWNAKPHVGTDKLRQVVKNIRMEIIRLGGEVHFGEKLEDVNLSSDTVASITTNRGQRETEVLLLALGHSARDTFEMLSKKGIALESKAFSVGVRIEHLQTDLDKMLYGKSAGNPLLPHGEYQLSHREGGRAVYTFCMCPGGVVVPASSEEGMITTNGMSAYARDEINANSALVVSVDSKDFETDPLAGVAFQRKLEQNAFIMGGGNYSAPIQTVGEFLLGRGGYKPDRIQPSYACGVKVGNFHEIFSPPVRELLATGLCKFQQKLKGFSSADVLLTGVETRTSSPVRLTRTPIMESVNTKGLYPCGEGAGYAGGIVSAGVDGLRAAEAVISKYKSQ